MDMLEITHAKLCPDCGEEMAEVRAKKDSVVLGSFWYCVD